MTETAKMYGGSLYTLAAEEKLDDEILGEFEGVAALFAENPEYLHLLSVPSIPKKERCGLIDEALGGQVHPYVVNFVKILCENGTLRELSGCAKEYRARYNEAHGIVAATAVSAVALTPEAKDKLEKRLSELTGKSIHLENRVDPAVLGGIRLDMAGERLDGTVAARLDALRREIRNTAF
jgi:F-type H+-transporting ATPase subunit delta